MNKFKYLLGALIVASMSASANARDQIEIVGSSTVFPFATTVAEQFGRSSKFKTPVVEATGSGGGMKLFCAGIGLEHPDITNASRRIKSSEFMKCQEKGIDMAIYDKRSSALLLSNVIKASMPPVFNVNLYSEIRTLSSLMPPSTITSMRRHLVPNWRAT